MGGKNTGPVSCQTSAGLKSHTLSERVLKIDPEMSWCEIRCNDVFGPHTTIKSLTQPDTKTKKAFNRAQLFILKMTNPVQCTHRKINALLHCLASNQKSSLEAESHGTVIKAILCVMLLAQGVLTMLFSTGFWGQSGINMRVQQWNSVSITTW